MKRQAKLTHDQAKHLHFYIPTRRLEADKMVDALNRLDQTDALVEQILGDRAKLEHHVYSGHAHPNSHMRKRIRWKLKLPRHPSRTTTITTRHRRTRRVINWIGIPKELMMTVIPWWTKTGPLWYPYHGKDLWTRMKRVRWQLGRKDTGKFGKICVIRSRDVATINWSQVATRKWCAKLCSKRNHPDETETSALHSETKARDHSTERVTGAELRKRPLLPLQTICTNANLQRFFFARRCFCTVASFVVLHVVRWCIHDCCGM